jgi:hypothetical protein
MMPCKIRYVYTNQKWYSPNNHAFICVFTVVKENLTLRMFNNNKKITTNENNYSMENNQ